MATAPLRECVTVLDRRLEAQAEELHAGVDALRSGIEALGRAQAEALTQWERRLARVEAGRAVSDGTPSASPPPVKGAAPQVIGRRPAVEHPWGYHPKLVTRAPEPGEELVYDEATPVPYAWGDADRRHAVWKRKEALKELEAARKRALKWRILTPGLWWN